MSKVIAALGLAGVLVPALAGAANIFEKVGTFDGQFLKIAVGARAAAMGGAFVAVSDDATALFWNAAGIARINPITDHFQEGSIRLRLQFAGGCQGIQKPQWGQRSHG